MKRQGRLIEQLVTLENLYLAFYKAQRGKAGKTEDVEYGKNLQKNLANLQQQLLTGDVEIGSYRYFTIYDPKQRLICAAPFSQRVLHHALINVCHPLFERRQIFDSYASRQDKGTYAALERAKKFTGHYNWFLKLDVRKYFDSLDHSVLKSQLRRLFKNRCLLEIFDRIIDSYWVTKGKGVPIGNLTSQYFANHYLSQLDHFVKESLKIRAYVRSMDDMVLWHDDKEFLLDSGLKLREYSADKLKLTIKPFCLNRKSHRLPFLGYLLYPETTHLAQRSRVRFIRKIQEYDYYLESENWSQKEYQQHVLPLINFTEYARAREFRKKLNSSV